MRRALLGLLLCGAAGAQGYTVQPGDTFWELSQRFGVPVAALQAANPGTLQAGQALTVPGKGSDALSPAPAALAVFQRGLAVYYTGKAHPTTAMTAAHLTLPFGTWVRVTHARTGRFVDVVVNDRGPFYNPARVIDLSATAARALGIVDEGVAPVTLTVLTGR